MATPRSCLSSLLLGVVVLACGGKEKPPPDPPVLNVALAGPLTVYCGAGSVSLQATITGGAPESVELLEDGNSVAQLAAPYQALFDCDAKAERLYLLSVRASIQGRAFTSTPKQIVVDRTRPTIVSGPFAANETEIPKDAPIRVTFSEPMRTDLVKATSVSLVSATKALSWSGDNKILTVTPQEPINAPQTFALILHPEDFEDLAGHRLVASNPTQWSWTIPAFLTTWRLPKHGGGLSSMEPPAFARDRAGRFIVAWFEYTQASGATDVYVHRSGASASTLLGGPLSAMAGNDSWVEEVAVAVDASDRPVVAWIEKAPTERQVFVRRWNGTNWEELAGVPNPITSADATGLTLATGSSELPAVAWWEADAAQRASVYVYRWDGARWNAVSSPIEARTPSASAIHPSLAIDGENRPVVAITEQSLDAAFLEEAVVWRLNGANWEQLGSALRPASASASASVNRISLALDPQGKPGLAFELSTPGTSPSADVYFSRYSDAGWSTPEWLAGPSAQWPSLSFDAEGTPWVAWENGTSAATISSRVLKVVADAQYAPVDQTFRPIFPNGGPGAPVLVVVDQQDGTARVVTRQ